MQRIILSLLTALLISSSLSAPIYAQQYESTPVTISREKVKINGQVCYSHIVLERQTLYSISKAYNVSLDEIYRFNPSVKEKGLQKNSILIIPVVEIASEPAAPAVEPEAEEQKVEEPVAEKTTIEEKSAESTPQRLHTVKWFEDLDIIAKKYGVSVDAIMKANGLTGRKLTKKQKLVIPYNDEFVAGQERAQESVEEQADTTQAIDSTAEKKLGILEGLLFPKKEVNLSLIMPFKATGTTSSAGNMDFYSGALLAVYDMANEGTSCELNVYDASNESIAEDSIENSDIIIGPVAPAELKNVLGMEPKAVVSPLDQRAASLTKTYGDLIQAPTPLDIQYKDLLNWIDEDMEYSDRFIVITEKGGTQTEATVQMKAAADSSGLEYKHLAYSILEGRNVTTSLEYIMTESGTNRVYIASDSEAFVNDVVRNLNLMIYKKYEVVLYAPSRIRNYETIEVENFHNTSLHVSTGYYIDYDDPRVQEFLLKYRALYNAEPTQFAFQGYDLAKYFIGMISKYGNRWTSKLEDSDASMLQSTLKFRKDGDGGYVNTGVRRIIYEDGWLVKRVR
jgi:LysM repeat protein